MCYFQVVVFFNNLLSKLFLLVILNDIIPSFTVLNGEYIYYTNYHNNTCCTKLLDAARLYLVNLE